MDNIIVFIFLIAMSSKNCAVSWLIRIKKKRFNDFGRWKLRIQWQPFLKNFAARFTLVVCRLAYKRYHQLYRPKKKNIDRLFSTNTVCNLNYLQL